MFFNVLNKNPKKCPDVKIIKYYNTDYHWPITAESVTYILWLINGLIVLVNTGDAASSVSSLVTLVTAVNKVSVVALVLIHHVPLKHK